MKDFEFTGPRYISSSPSRFVANKSLEDESSYLTMFVSIVGMLTIGYFVIEFLSSKRKEVK
jgi:hypothetical protein